MPIYAISATERNRIHPDPDDREGTWFDYRRVSLDTELEIDTFCTVNGRFDREKKLRVLLAWGIVGWSGYGISRDQPLIPYDFPVDFTEGNPFPPHWEKMTAEQKRKLEVLRNLPQELRASILNGMRASRMAEDADLKNLSNGWHAEPA